MGSPEQLYFSLLPCYKLNSVFKQNLQHNYVNLCVIICSFHIDCLLGTGDIQVYFMKFLSSLN